MRLLVRDICGCGSVGLCVGVSVGVDLDLVVSVNMCMKGDASASDKLQSNDSQMS